MRHFYTKREVCSLFSDLDDRNRESVLAVAQALKFAQNAAEICSSRTECDPEMKKGNENQ
jgi:hypothetical protein